MKIIIFLKNLSHKTLTTYTHNHPKRTLTTNYTPNPPFNLPLLQAKSPTLSPFKYPPTTHPLKLSYPHPTALTPPLHKKYSTNSTNSSEEEEGEGQHGLPPHLQRKYSTSSSDEEGEGDYHQRLKQYRDNKNGKKAEEKFKIWQKHYMWEPDLESYQILFEALLNSGENKLALNYLTDMMDLFMESISIDYLREKISELKQRLEDTKRYNQLTKLEILAGKAKLPFKIRAKK